MACGLYTDQGKLSRLTRSSYRCAATELHEFLLALAAGYLQKRPDRSKSHAIHVNSPRSKLLGHRLMKLLIRCPAVT